MRYDYTCELCGHVSEHEFPMDQPVPEQHPTAWCVHTPPYTHLLPTAQQLVGLEEQVALGRLRRRYQGAMINMGWGGAAADVFDEFRFRNLG